MQSTTKPLQTFSEDLLMRGIKIIDIGYITALYFILGIIATVALDYAFGTFDQKVSDTKHLFQIGLEIIFHMYIVGIIIYILRNVIEAIPFPLDGYKGFVHKRVKELSGTAVLSFTVLYFQTNLRSKIAYFLQRLQAGQFDPIMQNKL